MTPTTSATMDPATDVTLASSSDTGDAPQGCSADAECDDDNPCSIDGCDDGVCTHAVVTDDPTCACDVADDCTSLPQSDDCRVRACEDGVCTLQLSDDGTAVSDGLQQPGDCTLVVCDGLGGTRGDPDRTDVPVDGLECTDDRCDDAVPSNPAVRDGLACSAGECEGGVCHGCTSADQCSDGGECWTTTCTAGACGVDPIADGTPLPPADQTDGDCLELRCDGDGSAHAEPDDADTPPQVPGSCSIPVCIGGIEISQPRDAGTPCNGGVCDGDGTCVMCTDASQCPGGDACEQAACIDDICALVPATAGTECDDGLFCTLVDACDGAGACTGSQSPCPGPDGDNNCNESCIEATDACNGPDPAQTPCNDGQFCTAVDRCNGGGFCQGVGSPCPEEDGDFDCSESCVEATDSCNGDDEMGSSCGGECNVCDVNGNCDVIEPPQRCP